jgi:hypothetical protein
MLTPNHPSTTTLRAAVPLARGKLGEDFFSLANMTAAHARAALKTRPGLAGAPRGAQEKGRRGSPRRPADLPQPQFCSVTK